MKENDQYQTGLHQDKNTQQSIFNTSTDQEELSKSTEQITAPQKQAGPVLKEGKKHSEKSETEMLNVLIGNVGVNMPGKRREKKSEGTELRSRIETTLRSIVADRNRMSGYKKVVKAAKIYLEAMDAATKAVALNGVLESARGYLTEGSNKSYGVGRKVLCRDLIKDIGQLDKQSRKKDGAPVLMSGAEYLLNGGDLSNDMIDQEIRNAHWQANGGEEFLSMSESGRRKVFRRKLAEFRRANQLGKQLEEDDREELPPTILQDILSWDLNEFGFAKPADFLKKKNFTELYKRLRMAEAAAVLLLQADRGVGGTGPYERPDH
ncbi:MAG: hypothetical protein K5697_06865 [Lachnospiraceae bacterium]|nr:hypothetical protein [Lachnospiraceae bacterium]